ncbi:hypothetical protein [Nesterenkonia lutea]|uniref:Uncharacterized protein n=1 Tax=Nesterenkonia lutea TaxID=272919 RepID=A0ABR9JB65_9MICC|nr:hypothetical protein [Nesterenkonia lutea]MBE1523171.1 hypothetical protein [Nesterenkonia lutea]
MSLALFAYRIALVSALVLTTAIAFFDLSNIEAASFFRSFICRAFPTANGC